MHRNATLPALSLALLATIACRTGEAAGAGDRAAASSIVSLPAATAPTVATPAPSVTIPSSPATAAVTAPASVDAAPSDPRLAVALASTEGTAWVSATGDLGVEDVMFFSDGRYISHLHQRPFSAGPWRLNGETLTLEGWMGQYSLVIEHVHLKGKEVHGMVDGAELALRLYSLRAR
jgi:hypothetical protein